MNISQVDCIYFSPTRTTRKIVRAVADGLGGAKTEHDLTRPGFRAPGDLGGPSRVVLLGAPVYSGRIPAVAAARFAGLKARGVPAVLVVAYGNREFEDALAELEDTALGLGLVPVAGGAFVGEHSFSTDALPIAPGRPDSPDIQQARDFGARVAAKLSTAGDGGPEAVSMPGNRPYRDPGPSREFAPEADADLCDGCGVCANVCPVGAARVDGASLSDPGLCIHCAACVKACPNRARAFHDEFLAGIARRLHDTCGRRKAPRTFL